MHGQLLFDDRLEGLERLSPYQKPAVDKESRGSGDADSSPRLHILSHPGPGPLAAQVLLKGGEIQSQPFGQHLELKRGKVDLVEKPVAVLPEVALGACTIRSLLIYPLFTLMRR